MRQIELSPRLEAVAREVPAQARLVDVGTDHAYLPVSLIQRGQISSALASDVRSGPLENARVTAKRYEVTDRVQLRLCDGLTAIEAHEVDTVVIAGMGGETITNILSAALWTRACRCILQPMSSLPELRCWLSKNGFAIQRETLVKEGNTLYTIICLMPGSANPLTPVECWAGKTEGDLLRGEYLTELIARVERAKVGIAQSSKPEDPQRLVEMTSIADGLKRMKEEWDYANG